MVARRKLQVSPHYARTDRVNEVLRRVIAEYLEPISEDDPRLNLVTITGVDIDGDLRQATVFFSSLQSSGENDKIADALRSHRKALQSAIAREMRLKRTPQLAFAADGSIEAGMRVDEILRDISKPCDDVSTHPIGVDVESGNVSAPRDATTPK